MFAATDGEKRYRRRFFLTGVNARVQPFVMETDLFEIPDFVDADLDRTTTWHHDRNGNRGKFWARSA